MSKAAELAALIANVNKGSSLANKNFIINGAMNVAQRGTSFSFAHDGTVSSYTTDRFQAHITNTDEFDGTFAQVADAPSGTGLTHSLKWTTGTVESAVASDEALWIEQKIEAQNARELCYGTADAKPVTLSFWVKSSITGTFNASLYQADGNRIINNTYTISSTNTWEYKTLTFAGDTSGTTNNDTGEGLRPYWNIFAGSGYNSTDRTSWGSYSTATWAYGHAQNAHATTSGATFFLTGVQLEIGEKATEFEHEAVGATLPKCQRYYWQTYAEGTTAGTNSYNNAIHFRTYGGTSTYYSSHQHPVTMRLAPTVTSYGPTAATDAANKVRGSGDTAISKTNSYIDTENLNFYFTPNQNFSFITYHLTVDAEL